MQSREKGKPIAFSKNCSLVIHIPTNQKLSYQMWDLNIIFQLEGICHVYFCTLNRKTHFPPSPGQIKTMISQIKKNLKKAKNIFSMILSSTPPYYWWE